MPRKSKIDQNGLGDKVLAYAGTGIGCMAIVRQVNSEHPAIHLTPHNVEDYLIKHEALISKRRTESVNNAITMTLESVQSTLLETVGEIRQYLEEYKDDPRHAANFLKLKLDAIEKMTKMLGGYPSDHQAVNVQVNVVNAGEEFAKALKSSEDYFARIETDTLTEGHDTPDGPGQPVRPSRAH